ncbi:MAG: hypothetical protein ACFNYG_11630 [Lautropia mirabilis]
MGKQHAFGSKLSLSLAVAVSAVLTACGGGGGGSSTPTTPVAPNTPAATTPAANNTQTTPSSNQAMYEQLRTQCQVVSYTSEAGFYACAAGTYVGKNLKDGKTVCTVRLTRDGDVTYTMGDEVHAFKLAQNFFYSKSSPLASEYPHIWGMGISADSAADANEKVHSFELRLEPRAEAGKKPDHLDINHAYGPKYSPDAQSTCRVPL